LDGANTLISKIQSKLDDARQKQGCIGGSKLRWMLFLPQSKMCSRFMQVCSDRPISLGFDESGNVTDPTQHFNRPGF